MELPLQIGICPQCLTILIEGRKNIKRKCPKCNYRPLTKYFKDTYIHNRVRMVNRKSNNKYKGKHYKRGRPKKVKSK